MIVKCECEAVYEHIEIAVANWIEDTVDCKICGHELKSWRGKPGFTHDVFECPKCRSTQSYITPE
jgi:hypothetical protein